MEWVLGRMGEEKFETKMKAQTTLSKSFAVVKGKRENGQTVAGRGSMVRKETLLR